MEKKYIAKRLYRCKTEERMVGSMVILKEIDLKPAAKQMEKVRCIQEELKEEREI